MSIPKRTRHKRRVFSYVMCSSSYYYFLLSAHFWYYKPDLLTSIQTYNNQLVSEVRSTISLNTEMPPI